MRAILISLAALAAAPFQPVAFAAAPAAEAPRADVERDLARIRQATARFRDLNVALAEGYVMAPPGECVTAEGEGQPRQLGAMGVHFVRPDLLGITKVSPRVDGAGTNTDFTKPTVLVYEPKADGGYELVAVENLIFASAWHAAGHTQPPAFHDNQYYLTIDNPATAVDEAHGFEPHYELHIWLYRPNPAGMFMPYNVKASCAAAGG